MTPGDWAGVTAAGVVASAMVIVVKEFVTFLSNHMSANTKAMQDVSEALGKLTEAIRECPHR